MNQRQIQNAIQIFEKMENDVLNPFSSEEKMPVEYRDEWNSSMEDPKYTDFFLESLKNGELTNREELIEYFDFFCSQCETLINSFEDAEVLSGLFDRFQKKYKEKVRNAVNTDEEQDLDTINKTINKMNSFLPRFTYFEVQQHPEEFQVISEYNHNIPTKLFPI